jgi:hypothetical protein
MLATPRIDSARIFMAANYTQQLALATAHGGIMHATAGTPATVRKRWRCRVVRDTRTA